MAPPRSRRRATSTRRRSRRPDPSLLAVAAIAALLVGVAVVDWLWTPDGADGLLVGSWSAPRAHALPELAGRQARRLALTRTEVADR